jgi:rhodanese-related sulfurtransferase
MMQREPQSVGQKRLGIILNVAIVVAALVLSGLLFKKYLLPLSPNAAAAKTNVAPGSRLSLPATNWSPNTKTLLLFLHSECSYCASSAAFYQRLLTETARSSDVKLLALFSDADAGSEKYLHEANLSALESKQTDLASFGVSSTPTLVLVNGDGVVLEVWKGKLSPKQEAALIRTLGIQSAKNPDEWYIDEDAAKRLTSKKSATVIDLRGRENYNREHFADAINIPVDELPVRAINELSNADTIIVYGDYDGDEIADSAESILASQGFEKVLILRRKGK